MAKKMGWLKTRLRELGKTPAGLSRHLKLNGPRIYEVIAGRRGLQPREIRPTAAFLDLSVEEVLKFLPKKDRIMPANGTHVGEPSSLTEDLSDKSSSYEIKNNQARLSLRIAKWAIPMISTRPSPSDTCDAVLNGDAEQPRYVEPSIDGRGDVFAMYLQTSRMTPWRQAGEMVLFEKERPPKDNDHVVIYLEIKDQTCVIIRQLVHSNQKNKIRVREHNPDNEYVLDRKTVTSIFRVMTFDDIMR